MRPFPLTPRRIRMIFFGKKEKEVEKLIVEHIDTVKQTLAEFSWGIT